MRKLVGCVFVFVYLSCKRWLIVSERFKAINIFILEARITEANRIAQKMKLFIVK